MTAIAQADRYRDAQQSREQPEDAAREKPLRGGGADGTLSAAVHADGTYRRMEFETKEGFGAFDFDLKDRRIKGISAMVRAKNEEETLEASITSVEPFVDEIVIIDNASTDLTASVMKKLSRKFPGKIKNYHYPFNISKCGQEFRNTEENSVHSLAYYYNWCKSKCSYASLLKWDADMLIGEGQREF